MNKYDYYVKLVALHITQACNHKCSYCYAAAQNGKKVDHGSFFEICCVIDALSEAGVEEITLLGGDPAIHPKVVDIAKYVCNKNILVSILSNTHTYPNSSIIEATKYISSFESTIHHFDPIKHDQFCKKAGAYKKVTKALRIASKAGCKTGVALNITPDTHNEIFKIVQCLVEREKIDLDYVIIQRIIPQGRAAYSSDFTITQRQAEASLYQIEKVDLELGVKITVEDPFPLCILPKHLRKYMVPCEWGFTKCSVNSKGDLSRCGADPRYRFGNILSAPLLDIWNSSEILKSFRSRSYLPGRCKVCPDLSKCGGGCPLSCQVEKDHGIDYIYLDFEKIDSEIHGEIEFDNADEDELSSILQIEWANFIEYGHVFSVQKLREWYRHNPKMFYVVRDSRRWVLGFAAFVPIKKTLYDKILLGNFSSLTEFPSSEVLRNERTKYYHVEVLATIPTRTSSRAGTILIRKLGDLILKYAEFVTASPITNIGERLCKFFDFEYITDEIYKNDRYPIYRLNLNRDNFRSKLRKF